MKNENLSRMVIFLIISFLPSGEIFSQILEEQALNDTIASLVIIDCSIHKDSTVAKDCKEKKFGMEEECIDSHARIETLEMGFNSQKDVTFFTSIKFPVNNLMSGRLFLATFRINDNHNGKPGHYSTGAIDVTLLHSPIDLTIGLDNDRLGKNPYRRSEFIGAAFYFNEVPKLHKMFHIFRYSPVYHFYHTGERDSSTQSNGLQHSVFMQTQPVRFGKSVMLATETYFLIRKGSSLLEFDLGLRHKKIMSERLVIGATFAWQDWHYHGTMVFARFSIMQTNGVKPNW